jgi:hypothetical protein
MPPQADIAFVATYADGEEWFMVDGAALQAGDGAARQIAAEHQRKGRLPAGHILSVARMVLFHR